METISSFNLFIDSDNIAIGKGDNFNVALNSAGVQAGDGQFIRLSLQSFNCYKNWYDINTNNNKFRFYVDGGSVNYFYIPPKNYKTIGDVSTAFWTAFTTAWVALKGGTSVASLVKPDVAELMDDTSDRIISATITNSVSSTSIVIQACEIDGDGYAILGVDRVEGASPDTTSQSFNYTRTSGTVYSFVGKYPAQRSSEEHIYLRSDVVNNNIEMSGLSSGVMPTNSSSILSSDILAKIPISYEFCNFNTGTGMEFMMNIPNKTINTLHFYLTDSKGRTIGRAVGDSASAGGTKQNTLGNLNCSFVIKVEVIQAFQPNKLHSEPPPLNPLLFKKSGVLNNMNYGVGNF